MRSLRTPLDGHFTIAEIFHCYAYEHINTSGLGVVQKKNGKWKLIPHLTTPEGQCINDYISKDEFSFHHTAIYDAVALLGRFEKGALMAKLDLQAAFHMVLSGPLSGN